MLALHLDSVNAQLDALLELVCAELQLTQTQYDDATRSYTAVGEFLDRPGTSLAPFAPTIFPQGSMALGTTNKPRDREEFDVDLVCLLLGLDPTRASPTAVYEAVLGRLRESDRYRPKLRPKDRCIRIDYAGQFHLDVIPACPSRRLGAPWGELAIVISDRDRRVWVPTNPRGYALWFRTRAVPAEAYRYAASVEPLPPNLGLSEKTVLHRIVQLFKRRRDVHFDRNEFAPRSILLTTIDGLLYDGEGSLLKSMTQILDKLVAWGARSNGGGPPIVANPTDPSENLARHWREDHRHFAKFVEFVLVFQDGMERLRAARGTERIAEILDELFDPKGSGIVRRAVEAYTARFQQSRERCEIGFVPRRSGLVAVAATPQARTIRPNTFFGANY